MVLCRVTGNVVAPNKNETFERAKLLVVHPVDGRGEAIGRKDMLALDPKFDAGVGDYVLVARQGQVVHQIMGDKNIPANLIIVGVVDDWSLLPNLTSPVVP